MREAAQGIAYQFKQPGRGTDAGAIHLQREASRQRCWRCPVATSTRRSIASLNDFENAVPMRALHRLQGGLGRERADQGFVEAYGPSGSEDQVRELIAAEVKGIASSVRVDALAT